MDSESIIVVLSHANSEIKKHTLKECVKNLSGEILLSTNYPVDFETQKMCDWVIYDKKNEILDKNDYHKYDVVFNVWYIDENGNKIENPMDFDHGYAVYSLIRNAVRFAHSIGKKKIHILNYDYIVGMPEIMDNDTLLDDFDCVIYKYRDESAMCTSIFSGTVEKLIQYISKYNSLPEYYLTRGNVAFEWISFNIIESIGLNVFEKRYNDLNLTYKIDTITNVNQHGNYWKSETSNRFKEICVKYTCDKAINHSYHEIYPSIFEKFLDKEINLFEIGIETGKSVPVWKEFYPKCNIFGMDINPEINTDNINKLIIGDQSNISDLNKVIEEIPKCDIIIDDGSHVPSHQLKSFYFLFKNLLKEGGFYVIEDTECNYWDPLSYHYGYEIGYLNIVDYFTNIKSSS